MRPWHSHWSGWAKFKIGIENVRHQFIGRAIVGAASAQRIQSRLERLLHNLRNEHNAEADIRDIAREVIDAVDLNPDIALACIFLSQINGSYAVRHCIETAVVTVVIARAMQMTPPAR
jgi:hypothetical protein